MCIFHCCKLTDDNFIVTAVLKLPLLTGPPLLSPPPNQPDTTTLQHPTAPPPPPRPPPLKQAVWQTRTGLAEICLRFPHVRQKKFLFAEIVHMPQSLSNFIKELHGYSLKHVTFAHLRLSAMTPCAILLSSSCSSLGFSTRFM